MAVAEITRDSGEFWQKALPKWHNYNTETDNTHKNNLTYKQ